MTADAVVRNSVAVADPEAPSHVIKPNADGSINVAGSVPTGGATAANQTTQITAEQAILAKIIAAPATEAKQDTGNTSLASIATLVGTKYETVAASQTAQVLGSTGAIGDLINGLLVIPATTSPDSVLLLDNATSITVFTGGANSVTNLIPFLIPIGAKSVSGAWKVTTGANVSVIGLGNFT